VYLFLSVSSALTLVGAIDAGDAAAQRRGRRASTPRPAEPDPDAPGADDREAAANAFDRGTRSYLARDYPRAAEWFETAYRMAPAPAALIQAVRSHARAGNDVRAATLALILRSAYPDDEAATRQADQTLALATELVRVDLSCTARCTIELDGALVELTSFFVEPRVEHVVRATFDTGTVEERVSAGPGQTRTLELIAPPAPEVVTDTTTETGTDPARAPEVDARYATASVPPPPRDRGISPAFVIAGIGLTAVAGGVLIWSGIDTLDGVPAYEAMPTPERLADGQSREMRTNVLIGVTAGVGAIAAVLAIFTDWGGGEAEQSAPAVTTAAVAPIDGGAIGVLGGRL
jgi:hypothetical protein